MPFKGDNMSTEQYKLKNFCNYNFKLIDSYDNILNYYKISEKFETNIGVLENDDEKKVIYLNYFQCF